MNGREKSDPAVVAVKLPNKTGRPVAEAAERRAGAKGNAVQQSTHRAQNRERVSQALDRVRQAARRGREERFTALLHHVNVDALRLAFDTLRRDAAGGVDGGSVRGALSNARPYRDPKQSAWRGTAEGP
jgi:RNA-directed DNA polymerase